MAQPSDDWLTLSEASSLMGIHPITLRSWADAGLVPMFRTPGGHRRFRRSELDAFLDTRNAPPSPHHLISPPDQTLALIRQAISTHPIQQSEWYAKLSDEQRALHRMLGQRLLGLLLQYVSRTDNAHDFLEQARDLSRQYGIELARAHLGSGDLARAFLFFRRAIINATYHPAGAHAQGDADGIRLLERINEFMDELLIAALNDYDRTLEQQIQAPAPRISKSRARPQTKPRTRPRH